MTGDDGEGDDHAHAALRQAWQLCAHKAAVFLFNTLFALPRREAFVAACRRDGDKKCVVHL